MKQIFFLFLLLFSTYMAFSQVAKPGKPAFVVTYEQNGKNTNESWHYQAIIKFSLSNWNQPLVTERLLNKGTVQLSDLKAKPMTEFDPILFLKLEPGQKVNFYPSEVNESGTGTNGKYTRVLTDDGVQKLVENYPDRTNTEITTDADYRKANNIPLNEAYSLNARFYQQGELAELERTATGAILYAYSSVGDNMSEWAVSDETMEQVFPEVEKFVLTENDIRNWANITRSNSRTGNTDGNSLTVKLSVRMNVPGNK